MATPSAVLVARSSRSPNNLSAALSSPTETHAAAAGIFRSSASSPPWSFEECGEEEVSELEVEEDAPTAAIEIEETFTKRARYVGTVKIIVEKTTFRAHKEILVFASPFFEAALSGSWSETGRRESISSIITLTHRPSTSSDALVSGNENESQSDNQSPTTTTTTVASIDDKDASEALNSISESETEHTPSDKETARTDSLGKLERSSSIGSRAAQMARESSGKKNGKRRKRKSRNIDAVIVLKDEKAPIFQDFLKYAYPHLNCVISWRNVEGLMNLAHKLVVEPLKDQCLNFLLTHAAGNPVKAMSLAETFSEENLFQESSRFVLDNPEGWCDIACLSQGTQLKLERKRTWFLERVLKLGLTNIAREYQCSATCPEPAVCAKLLEEKWKQGYQSAMRFGPCQPSIVWRFLRMLEISPPLALTQLACQNTARNFAATLFDRMFSLGMRGTGTESAIARAGIASSAHARYFLFVTLRDDRFGPRKSKARDTIAL